MNMLGVFKDPNKPYDTVNHEKPLHKLKTYGINGWFLDGSKVTFQSEISASSMKSMISTKNLSI